MPNDISFHDDQFDLSRVDIVNNQTQRLPCVILVDGSGSMIEDGKIDALNSGLKDLEAALKNDPFTRVSVQVMIIRFGGEEPTILTPWTDAAFFTAPDVIASGRTPMGKAMDLAMQELEDHKAALRREGITFKRPWVWLLSDGGATDIGWEQVAERSRQAQQNKKFYFYPVSVFSPKEGNDHAEILRKFGDNRKVIPITAGDFEVFFEILSSSMSKGSSSESEAEDAFFFLSGTNAAAAQQRTPPSS
jgi:uncharacterized protein YegL